MKNILYNMQNLRIQTKIFMLVYAVLIGSLVILFVANKQRFEENAKTSIVHKATAITLQAENTRRYISQLRTKNHAFDDEKLLKEAQDFQTGKEFKSAEERIHAIRQTNFYWTIPIVSSWSTANVEAEKTGYTFRVPKIQARNPKNEATPLEVNMLEEIKSKNLEEYWIIDKESNALRYMRPIRLTQDCLICHGTIQNDLDHDGIDPVGFKMEGWKEGEIHGAFEIIADLSPMQNEIANNFKQSVMLIGILLAISTIAILLITRSISIPLQKAVHIVTSMAEGNLHLTFDAYKDDEIGQLLKAMEIMIQKLRTIITEVNQLSLSVSSRTEQANALITQLRQGAGEQATALEEALTSMQKMSEGIQSNSTHAQKTDELSAKTNADALNTGESVSQTVQGIISIGERISVIEEIAKKTNLLALNASLEAVRAGEHGKGFEIVAQQVQQLAERSRIAAADIIKLTHQSVRTAEDSGTKINALLPNIERTSTLVREIAFASEQQSTSSQQISVALSQLEYIATQNSDIAIELETSSNYMQQLISELQDLMTFRTIDENADTIQEPISEE